MRSEKFRRQLREESQDWQQEGLIDAGLYQQLAERYAFDRIEDSSSNRFIGILLGVGGILLGLGVITFVAANWQDWSKIVRVSLLLTIFMGVNTVGFYLWQSPHPTARLNRLGYGLLLTGALVLGANLGLMSQMFHQSGPLYHLLVIWSLGVLAMAYGLRLSSLGILSWILMMSGYWGFLITTPFNSAEVSLLPQFMLYLPLGISVLYLPLAHWLRSRSLFGLWGISFAILFALSQSYWSYLEAYSPWAIASTLTLPPALLWFYRSNIFSSLALATQPQTSLKMQRDSFQSLGQSLSIWGIGIALYWFSFRFWWTNNPFVTPLNTNAEVPWVAPLSCCIYLGMTLMAGWHWWTVDRDRSQPSSQWMKTPVVAVILSVIYGLGVAFVQGATLSIIGPVIMNAMVFILSFMLLHDGLKLGIRRRFWGGMSLLVLGLISRMFEYNTSLIVKAIVLTACGLGIIAAGLWFEYQAKLAIQRTTVSENGFMNLPPKLKHWHFWVPMLLQTIFIIAVPLQSAVVYSTGRAVTLQTAPIDPYDILRGYSQILSYEISDPEVLSQLPGGSDIFSGAYETQTFSIYVVLQAPASVTSPPSAWTPIRVSRDRPQSLPHDQVVLKGRYREWSITYGLETFYMPERDRNAINAEIREVQQSGKQDFVVDIKVDHQGISVPNSLWVGDRHYRF